jgi:hypothetical protein
MAATGELVLSDLSDVDRRMASDRRRNRLRTLFCSLYMRRRRQVRRHGCPSSSGYYLDVIERRIIAAAVAVMLLSCADSAFTLALLQRGAEEVNPLMRYLIEINTGAFVGGKLTITAAGVLFLVAHGHFRLFRVLRGHHGLYVVLAVYLTLFNYQVALLGG